MNGIEFVQSSYKAPIASCEIQYNGDWRIEYTICMRIGMFLAKVGEEKQATIKTWRGVTLAIILTILMACVAVYSEANGNKSRLKQKNQRQKYAIEWNGNIK